MLPQTFVARVLVAIDLSPETDEALACAEELRASRPTAIDVYYLWPDDGGPYLDAADRTIAAAASFALKSGAWDRLDRLGALERRGVLAVQGWLTRACRGGRSLTALAAREGYHMVVVGLERPPQATHLFELHRLEVPARTVRGVA